MKKITKKVEKTIEAPKELPKLSIDQQVKNKLDSIYNPFHNAKAISIIQQPDGNWIGEMNKGGNVVSSRQGDPQTVLTMLITHE